MAHRLSAKPKRGSDEDRASFEPMAAATRGQGKIRRNPSTDQKKVRRSQVRKTAGDSTKYDLGSGWFYMASEGPEAYHWTLYRPGGSPAADGEAPTFAAVYEAVYAALTAAKKEATVAKTASTKKQAYYRSRASGKVYSTECGPEGTGDCDGYIYEEDGAEECYDKYGTTECACLCHLGWDEDDMEAAGVSGDGTMEEQKRLHQWAWKEGHALGSKTATRETTVGELKAGDVIDGATDNNGGPLTVEDVQVLGPIAIIDYTDNTASAPVPTNGRVVLASKTAADRDAGGACPKCGSTEYDTTDEVTLTRKCSACKHVYDYRDATKKEGVAADARTDDLGLSAGDPVHKLGDPEQYTFVAYDLASDRATIKDSVGNIYDVSPDVILPDDEISRESRLTPSRTASIHDHILGHLRGRH